MKRLLVLALIILAFTANQTSAQVKFGARGGVNVNEGGDSFAGAHAEISLPVLPITFVPNAEYYFVDKGKSINANLDFQYTFIGVGVAKLVAGGGYTLNYNDPDVSGVDATKKSGFNAQFGAKASLVVNVFGLIRMTRVDGKSTNSFVVGITF